MFTFSDDPPELAELRNTSTAIFFIVYNLKNNRKHEAPLFAFVEGFLYVPILFALWERLTDAS